MNNWQPIETAPKDDSFILLFVPDDSPDIQCGTWYRYRNIKYNQTLGCFTYQPAWTNGHIKSFNEYGEAQYWAIKPTHWMPLPERPKTPTPTHWVPLPEPPTIPIPTKMA